MSGTTKEWTLKTLFAIIMFAALFCASASAQPVVTVTPWLTSLSQVTTAGNNAVAALLGGAASYGTPGTPTYFHSLTSPVPVEYVIRSFGFNYWNGSTDPNSAFGSAYAGETGRGLAFGFRAVGNGTKITVADITATTASQDPAGKLSLLTMTYAYGYGCVGIDYGSDGIRGTTDDIVVSAGSRSIQVDEIVAAGYPVTTLVTSFFAGATYDDKVAGTMNTFFSPAVIGADTFTVTGAFVLNTAEFGAIQGAATQTLVSYGAAIPEPATWGVIVLGSVLVSVAWVRRRKAA